MAQSTDEPEGGALYGDRRHNRCDMNREREICLIEKPRKIFQVLKTNKKSFFNPKTGKISIINFKKADFVFRPEYTKKKREEVNRKDIGKKILNYRK